MANQDTNYGNIFNPYNSNLERASSSTDGSVIPSTSGESIQTPTGTPTAGTPTAPASASPVAPPASVQGNSLIDLYIETFIKSRNYQPKVQGIYLDGRTGYLEAQTGNIANWDFTRDQLSSGSVYIQSTAERILMGAATAPLTGIGIFLGKDSADYEFRAGNPVGDYIHWDGTTLSVSGSIIAGSIDIGGADATSFHVSSAGNMWLGAATYDIATNPFAVSSAGVLRAVSGTIGGWTLGATTLTGTGVTMSSTGDAYLAIGTTPPTGVATGTGIFINKTGLFGLSANTQNFKIDATNGNITANAGTIGGFTITSTTLYGGIIKTAATVGAGTTGVIMDSTGLKGYDSVLGNTFSLPTDGSAPTFSSGIINETIFKISTNAVLRTSETVGDGSVDSAGVLINNTGMYGCVASQTLAGANIRILNIGTLFAGNNTNYFYWDGTYVRIKGNLDLTSIFNNISYLVSELPIPPTTEGFLSPTAYEY